MQVIVPLPHVRIFHPSKARQHLADLSTGVFRIYPDSTPCPVRPDLVILLTPVRQPLCHIHTHKHTHIQSTWEQCNSQEQNMNLSQSFRMPTPRIISVRLNIVYCNLTCISYVNEALPSYCSLMKNNLFHSPRRILRPSQSRTMATSGWLKTHPKGDRIAR